MRASREQELGKKKGDEPSLLHVCNNFFHELYISGYQLAAPSSSCFDGAESSYIIDWVGFTKYLLLHVSQHIKRFLHLVLDDQRANIEGVMLFLHVADRNLFELGFKLFVFRRSEQLGEFIEIKGTFLLRGCGEHNKSTQMNRFTFIVENIGLRALICLESTSCTGWDFLWAAKSNFGRSSKGPS